MTEEQVRAALAKAVDAAGGQRAFGRKHSISPTRVGQVLEGEAPGDKICAALGIERETLIKYRRLKK